MQTPRTNTRVVNKSAAAKTPARDRLCMYVLHQTCVVCEMSNLHLIYAIFWLVRTYPKTITHLSEYLRKCRKLRESEQSLIGM